MFWQKSLSVDFWCKCALKWKVVYPKIHSHLFLTLLFFAALFFLRLELFYIILNTYAVAKICDENVLKWTNLVGSLFSTWLKDFNGS